MANHSENISNLPSVGRNGNRLGIIQLSDLQFGRKHRFKDSSDFVRKLVSDIRDMSERHNFRPLYMVLSGDISQTGHSDEFAEAVKVVDGLSDDLNIDVKKILCVPGNHDINWNLSKLAEEAGDEQLKFLPYNNFISTLTKNNEHLIKDRYVRRNEQITPSSDNLMEPSLDEQNIPKLEILLLNSCEKEDHNNHEGYVCKEKLLRTLQIQKDEEQLKIAIMHHRLETIPNEAAGITNARDIQTILEYNKYNIVLTGHVHQSTVKPSIDSTGHTIIYASCGSTGVPKEAREDGIQNQYCIHVLDFDRNKFQTIWRAFNPAIPTENGRGGWTQDNCFQMELTEFDLPAIKQRQFADSQAQMGDLSSSKHILVSKTEKDKMKLAFLNLLGGWKENG